jgi:hypothetical protein
MNKPRKKRFSGFSLPESLKVVGVQYAKQYDAEMIAKILKGIVSKYVNPASN